MIFPSFSFDIKQFAFMELFDLDSIKVNSIFWLISFILFSGIKSNSHPVEAETILYWKTLYTLAFSFFSTISE